MRLFVFSMLVSAIAAFVPALARSVPHPAVAPVLQLPRPLVRAQLRPSPVKMAQLGGGGFGGGGGFDPRSLITPLVLGALIASGALGWLFNGLLFLALVPLIVGPLVSWYISSNLLEGNCPECGSAVQVLNGQRGQCFSCGATMSSELSPSGVFTREGAAATDDGVVEVEVVRDD